MTNAVTTPQLKAIHVCKRELGLCDEAYRNFLQSRCNVDSAKDLTRQQATALIRYWNGQLGREPSAISGQRSARSGRDERLPNELVTKEMSYKITELLIVLGFDDNTGIMQARPLIKRICGAWWPQTRKSANVTIEALKSMIKRGWKPRKAEGSRPKD